MWKNVKDQTDAMKTIYLRTKEGGNQFTCVDRRGIGHVNVRLFH